MMLQIDAAKFAHDTFDRIEAEGFLDDDEKRNEVFSAIVDTITALIRERDEARAMVDSLREILSETISHLAHPCETVDLPNHRHCSGCQHAAYIEGALTGVSVPDRAAEERAKIVAYLGDTADACARFGTRNEADHVRNIADSITRLDHHRDREGW